MCKESTQGATTGSVAELLLDKDKNIYPSPRAPYMLLIWLRTQVNKRSCPWQRRCQCLLLWNRKLDAFAKQQASGFSGCETLSSPVSQTYSDPILLVQQDTGTISISELSNLSLLFFDYIVKLNLEVRGLWMQTVGTIVIEFSPTCRCELSSSFFLWAQL